MEYLLQLNEKLKKQVSENTGARSSGNFSNRNQWELSSGPLSHTTIFNGWVTLLKIKIPGRNNLIGTVYELFPFLHPGWIYPS